MKELNFFSIRLIFFQIVLVTMESRKCSELLDLLDLNPNIGQKTLVITRSAMEVEELFKVKQFLFKL